MTTKRLAVIILKLRKGELEGGTSELVLPSERVVCQPLTAVTITQSNHRPPLRQICYIVFKVFSSVCASDRIVTTENVFSLSLSKEQVVAVVLHKT